MGDNAVGEGLPGLFCGGETVFAVSLPPRLRFAADNAALPLIDN
tara:strand:- start:326 stop:457 length:132 start_codon:yes stop_codon:yes gene_type:complete